MKPFKFNPLDLLTTPKPLNYKFYPIKRTISGEITYITDYSHQNKKITNESYSKPKRLRKRRFEREVMKIWEEADAKKNQDPHSDAGKTDLVKSGTKRISEPLQDQSVNLPSKTDEDFFTPEYFNNFGQPVNYVPWEDDIIYETSQENEEQTHSLFSTAIFEDEPQETNLIEKKTLQTQFISTVFNTTPWEQSIIYDKLQNFDTNTEIWLNDQNLIFSPPGNRNSNHSYNISLDKYYTEIKRNKETLGITHSIVGIKMMWEELKSIFTASENHGSIIVKKKSDKTKNIDSDKSKKTDKDESFKGKENVWRKFTTLVPAVQSLNTLSDHTLADTNKFAIFEYAEEVPMIKQKMGMGSILVQYTFMEHDKSKNTTKTTDSQNNILDNDIAPIIMQINEEPFPVKLRENTVALLNNMFKARVYKHSTHDYLLIIKDGTFFIREISNLYCVGQTFPSEEIFSPHSRRLNIYCRNRLKQFCFRYKKQNKKKNKNLDNSNKSYNSHSNRSNFIPASLIDKEFPLFTDGSKKKWLKEYTDTVRENNTIFYRLKSEMEENEIDNLVAPEQVCLYESTISYQQNLHGLESPWTLSKNYLQFKKKTSGIEIINDYTGIGEGISFRTGIETEIPYELWDREKKGLTCTNVEYEMTDEKQEKEDDIDEDSFSSDLLDLNMPYILITRVINGEKQTEKVSDPEVIDLYLKMRSSTPVRKRTSNKTSTSSLRCGACNEIGHMKTNKSCPKFVSRKKNTVKQKKAKQLLNSLIAQVISQCLNLNFSNAFTRPVSAKKFPDYPKIVKTPIDIGVMRGKTKSNLYSQFCEFEDDLKLMKSNCILYNGEVHGLSVLAGKMLIIAQDTREQKKSEIEELEKLVEIQCQEEIDGKKAPGNQNIKNNLQNTEMGDETQKDLKKNELEDNDLSNSQESADSNDIDDELFKIETEIENEMEQEIENEIEKMEESAEQ